jgi:L-alanine-DL-glutamate epimerase-like enolase superfamily enzyme
MASTPIVSIRCSLHTYPIVVPFSIALESLPVAKIVIVQCFDANGVVGVGEAAPFPSLTYDTTDSALLSLNEIKTALLGIVPGKALTVLKERSDIWRKNSVTAYCGIESALLDLQAKQKGVPLSQLYGSANVKQVETDITLPIMPVANVNGFFSIFSSYGFRTIKIKVSGNVTHDLDLVHAVLSQVPKGTVITLDGNQGFQLVHAKTLISELHKHDIQPAFFEQPLNENDWSGVWDLAKSSGVVLCLDEAIRTARDLKKVINEAGALLNRIMINLKIMKSGIFETLDLIDIATDAGIPLMIGGMLESDIAMTHSLHIACGTGGIKFFDLDTPFFFKTSPAISSPWTKKSSVLAQPTGPGLGIDLAPLTE